jgi:hypothetical protein
MTFSGSEVVSYLHLAFVVSRSNNEIMIVQDLAIRIETCIQAGENPASWIDQLETSTSAGHRYGPAESSSRIFWARGTFGTRTVHRRATAS